MTTKITRDVLESYLRCKYKGHLKLTGQQGTKCDYETLLTEMRAEVRLAAIDNILTRHAGEEIPRNIPLTTSVLKQGASFLLDAALDDDLVAMTFDGLKKVAGPSKLGDFHYIPMLFHEGSKVHKEQKLLLELYGLLLSRLQGQMPAHGIIWHGKECEATRVRVNADLRKTERLIRDLKEMCSAESPSKLMLNDHCQVCEFRQRCHEQALKDDNVSLLRGLGDKELTTFGKKGIFTVTQLAHTFRPRRKGRRTKQKTTSRNIALQALAIRDKRIYVLGTPDVPAKPVQIYLDIEGIPEEGFVYLIGMIVKTDGLEQSYSFWANNKDEERHIFEHMIAEILKHDSFIVYCYGAYERTFIKRMRQIASNKTGVDKVLNSLVNALSIVYSNFYFPTYTNGLKDIGTYLGCSWSEPDSSGIQSIVWRRKWEVGNEESWKQKLAKYNLEDCQALRNVMDFIHATITGVTQGTDAQPSVPMAATVTQVEDVEKLQDYETWGDVNFYFPDFQHVNNCSHFDYQRERVYARTRKLAKRKKKSRKNGGP